MATPPEARRLYVLPQGDFFRRFLEGIARSAGTGVAAPALPDETLAWVASLEAAAPPVFAALGRASGGLETRREVTALTRSGDFDSTITTVTVSGPGATYAICLDRMFNGHLGCNEDQVVARFDSAEKTFTLKSNAFVSPTVTFEARGLSTAEVDALDRLWRETLGLKPPA